MAYKNPCVYCGAPSYGPGCPFSPNKIHFHASDPKKCVYCGSVAHGPGCPFNPHSDVHVHGVEFNSMVKETIDKSITLGFLMNALSTPITEMKAYKLGLINENGKSIKAPTTPEEYSAYGALEKYIIGLKQGIGNKLDLVNGAINVQLESAVTMEEYSTICEAKLNLQEKFSEIGAAFNEIVVSAYSVGLSSATIEKLIIDSILEKKKK